MRTISIVFLSLLLSFPAFSDEVVKTISVTGQGYVEATPDEFHFSLYVEEKGSTLTKLNDLNARKTASIVSFLQESGVSAENIQSMHVQVSAGR